MANDPVQLHVPPSAPRGGSGLLAWFGRLGLRILKWRLTGSFVDKKKLIVVVAPHTSNWDWIIGVCALWALRLKFSYFVKDSLFFWPLGLLMRGTGGIPVNRSNPEGVLEEVTSAFRSADKLYFAITPEGTRKEVSRWKSGFLRIAYATELPVVPALINIRKREVQVFEPLELDGDIDADLDRVQAFFSSHGQT